MNTASTFINWYKHNKRDLPWRNTSDPYFIWLSEVIMQQTRVEQGTSYYLKFIKKFPAVKKLASAPESEILKLWQGLGYYSRARNLHAAAKSIVKNHAGIFPGTYKEIESSKGVGDYTAAAIASFAFHQKYAVVDGNVYRFLSRYFGISTPIDSSKGKKEFQEIAGELLADHPPHVFNQAIMEFGAMQCKPVSPVCPACPLQNSCYAYENNKVKNLPVKSKKIVSRDRYFYYLIVRDKKSVYLQQRKEKDIWQNLYEFPLIESKKKLNNSALLKEAEWKSFFRAEDIFVKSISEERKHILSHQVLRAKFVELSITDKNFKAPEHWKKVSVLKINDYAVPRLIDKYLQEQKEFYQAAK